MARRRRGRRGHKGKNRSFPLLLLAPVIPAAKVAWDVRATGPYNIGRNFVQSATGFDVTGQLPFNYGIATRQVGLVIGGIIGHKIANKVGINKWMKRLTMGYITL